MLLAFDFEETAPSFWLVKNPVNNTVTDVHCGKLPQKRCAVSRVLLQKLHDVSQAFPEMSCGWRNKAAHPLMFRTVMPVVYAGVMI